MDSWGSLSTNSFLARQGSVPPNYVYYWMGREASVGALSGQFPLSPFYLPQLPLGPDEG